MSKINQEHWMENTIANPFFKSTVPVEVITHSGRHYVIKCPRCVRGMFNDIHLWRVAISETVKQPTTNMHEYQVRVVAEKRELDERIEKLKKFILSDRFNELQAGERERMNRQLVIMAQYSAVLGERILAFTP